MSNASSKEGCLLALRILYWIGASMIWIWDIISYTSQTSLREFALIALLPVLVYIYGWSIIKIFQKVKSVSQAHPIAKALFATMGWICFFGLDLLLFMALFLGHTERDYIYFISGFYAFQVIVGIIANAIDKKRKKDRIAAIVKKCIKISFNDDEESPSSNKEYSKGGIDTPLNDTKGTSFPTPIVQPLKETREVKSPRIDHTKKQNIVQSPPEPKTMSFGDIVITKKYFIRLDSLCRDFQEFITHLSWKKDFSKIVSDQYELAFNEKETVHNILKKRVLSDIMTCYKLSNYEATPKSREYLGMVLLSSIFDSSISLKFEDIPTLQDKYLFDVQSYFDEAQQKFAVDGDGVSFGLASMLIKYDKTLALQYYVNLYRYVEAIIMADEVVTTDEKFVLDVLQSKMAEIEPGFNINDDLYLTNDVNYQLSLRYGTNLVETAKYVFRKKTCAEYDIRCDLDMNPAEVQDAIDELKRRGAVTRTGQWITSCMENEYQLIKMLKKGYVS